MKAALGRGDAVVWDMSVGFPDQLMSSADLEFGGRFSSALSGGLHFMRRFVTILPFLLALGLLIGGGWFLAKASRSDGWQAAVPALSGIACWIAAAIFVGKPAARLVAYPITAVMGHLFYPESRFTEPPQSLLLSLRQRIEEGRFRLAEHQVRELLKAYPRDPGLYHVWALLEVAKGRPLAPVTTEASRFLSASAFATYEALLREAPPRTKQDPYVG